MQTDLPADALRKRCEARAAASPIRRGDALPVVDMLPPFDPWLCAAVSSDVASASLAGPQALQALQTRRLRDLVASARRDSPLYRRLLAGVGATFRLQDLPITHKRDLMRQFDEWSTDPAVRFDSLRRFTADRARIAEPFLGRYTVWQSSGSSGEPAIFVQDATAMAVYDALEALRRPWPATRLLDPWYIGERIVFMGATGGHFASIVSTERLRRLNAALALNLHDMSFLQPTDELVAKLHALAPTIVSTYPSAAMLLAEERLAGRLHIEPQEIWTGGETLTPAMRRFVQEALRCPVIDSYGASEFLRLSANGRNVSVLPLALSTVLEDDAGLFDFQLEQVGPASLRLTVPMQGDAARASLQRGRSVLADFLTQQGAPGVQIRCRSGHRPQRGTGGKVQRVIASAAGGHGTRVGVRKHGLDRARFGEKT